MYENLKCQKLPLKKWRDHIFLGGGGNCTAKNKDIALKLCMHFDNNAFGTYFDNVYSSFYKLKVSDIIGKYCFNENFEFGEPN